MFNIVRKEINWGGRKLVIETGKMARQADGAVVARLGDTIVLCTAVAEKKAKDGIDFFPLTVNYQEKYFAAGKIPGGYFRREGKPTEKDVLTSRLIDRPIRPLFPNNFRNETQVICTTLSYDGENDPDVVALIGASAALSISGIPFLEPVACARVGYVGGEYILNPSVKDLPNSKLDLVVAGTESSVLMVESEAKELSEEVMLGAVMFGHKEFQPVINLIKELKAAAGKSVWNCEDGDQNTLKAKVSAITESALRDAFKEREKQARKEKIDNIKADVLAKLLEEGFAEQSILNQFKEVEKDIVRNNTLNGMRIDGRNEKEIRSINCEISALPRVHGSSLFTRGETQALVVSTLGTEQDEQMVEELEGLRKDRFMLHYNFPPFSVGEVGRFGAPGRRETGHGNLAKRAINPVLPTKEEFPYTLRIVSEITESNGSSSMATVCGASLALMDAGVPIKKAVAGIAMGLIKEGDKFIVLSDIMGDEDHLGDMDFKVAGTDEGVTALQMDIKINGINEEIMKIALSQAKEGRAHILSKMNSSIEEPRAELNSSAPKITTIQVPKDKIGEIIGSGGKVIREICEVSGAKVDISDDGIVKIASVGTEPGAKALQMINDIIAVGELGKIYTGKVVKIVDFGAFINFIGNQEGLLHISEITEGRVEQVTDVLQEGDTVKVKLIGMERNGKVKLSMRVVDQETGEDLMPDQPLTSSEDSSGGGRHHRGGGGRGGDRDRGGDKRRDHRGGERGDRGDRDYNNRDRGDAGRRDRGERANRGDRYEGRGDKERGDRGNRGDKRKGGRDRDSRDNFADKDESMFGFLKRKKLF